MPNYLLIYRADPAAMAAMPEPTTAQMEEMAAAWYGWRDRLGTAMVDFGDPTVPASAGADPSVGGYSVIRADDHAAAEALLDGHPHRAMGGQIDVYEVRPFIVGEPG